MNGATAINPADSGGVATDQQGWKVYKKTVTVTSDGAPVAGAYLIVDLTSGSVSEVDTVPSDLLTNDAYKTTKIVLRKISAGTFLMGSPADETGRSSDETQHSVTLTKDFYIGVFEVTQKQFEMVMGYNPSYYDYTGDKLPVGWVSWESVRGGTWPSGNPDSASFMGKLRTLTSGSYNFDLPTEAQWEYACRAGTTKAYNNDTDCQTVDVGDDTNLDMLGWYYYNAYIPDKLCQEVGTKQPNNWGLYDMHGNVREWCLDLYGSYPSGSVTDPEGPPGDDGAASWSVVRVLRGGYWGSTAKYCRSASRFHYDWIFPGAEYGFRVALSSSP